MKYEYKKDIIDCLVACEAEEMSKDGWDVVAITRSGDRVDILFKKED